MTLKGQNSSRRGAASNPVDWPELPVGAQAPPRAVRQQPIHFGPAGARMWAGLKPQLERAIELRMALGRRWEQVTGLRVAATWSREQLMMAWRRPWETEQGRKVLATRSPPWRVARSAH